MDFNNHLQNRSQWGNPKGNKTSWEKLAWKQQTKKLQDLAQAVLRGTFSQQMSTLRKKILIIKLNLYHKEQNKRKKKKNPIKYKKEKPTKKEN